MTSLIEHQQGDILKKKLVHEAALKFSKEG